MDGKSFLTEVKPIWLTYKFEIKKQAKKFAIFATIILAIGILVGYVLDALIAESLLSNTQIGYLRGSLGFLNLIMIFATCFFFSGIICSEFADRTGFITFPKINKYKLIVGKYLGSFTMALGVIMIYYYVLGIVAINYYGGPLDIRYFMSFGIAVIYLLALSSFVTLFSSFMKSVNITIITTILLLFIGFDIITQIQVLNAPDVEPLYSLTYLGNLISSVLIEDFPTKISERYTDINVENFTFRAWLHPSIQAGIMLMLTYTVLCLLFAALIFRRRQL